MFMEVEMQRTLEIMRKSKIYKPIMRNFKLPILVGFLILMNYSYKLFYNSRFIDNLQKYSVIFFMITLVVFTLVTIKMTLDIFSIIFFQKGQDSLKDKAKK